MREQLLCVLVHFRDNLLLSTESTTQDIQGGSDDLFRILALLDLLLKPKRLQNCVTLSTRKKGNEGSEITSVSSFERADILSSI